MPSLPIRMPQLGEAAAEAVVKAWLVQPGDAVKIDQDILEVETEKSVLTVTAPADGTLLDQVVNLEERCAVGDVLGHIGVESVDGGDDEVSDPDPTTEAPKTETQTISRPSKREPTDENAGAVLSVPARTDGMGYFSPRLRARMSEYGLRNDDITGIRGTGRAGRVSVNDLERFFEELEEEQVTDASPMRLAVSDSMRRSWNRPLATIAMDVCMDPIMTDRRKRAGRPSATVYGVAALAQALKADDALACRLFGKRMIHPKTIDIAVAMEADDGVLTPVLPKSAQSTLEELTVAYDKAFEDCKERRVSPANSGSSVASVSNYGTFGITWATPIPLPDQSLILGIGAVRNVPDWNPRDKTWDRVRSAELTLTFDHRVADGGAAGRLLKRIADFFLHPDRLP